MTSAMQPGRPLRVTVSGSFKRHLWAIQGDVARLAAEHALVLSPSDPRIVDSFGEFVFVSSDHRRSIKGIQNRHLEAIRESDFLWLACPDGYVGQSAALEVGFAIANSIPIYSDVAPSDWTLRQYVTPVGTVERACAAARGSGLGEVPQQATLLISPDAVLESVRTQLDVVEHSLLVDRTPSAADPVEDAVRDIKRLLVVPTVL